LQLDSFQVEHFQFQTNAEKKMLQELG